METGRAILSPAFIRITSWTSRHFEQRLVLSGRSVLSHNSLASISEPQAKGKNKTKQNKKE